MHAYTAGALRPVVALSAIVPLLTSPDSALAHLAVQYFQRYLERDVFASIPRSIELAARHGADEAS